MTVFSVCVWIGLGADVVTGSLCIWLFTVCVCG